MVKSARLPSVDAVARVVVHDRDVAAISLASNPRPPSSRLSRPRLRLVARARGERGGRLIPPARFEHAPPPALARGSAFLPLFVAFTKRQAHPRFPLLAPSRHLVLPELLARGSITHAELCGRGTSTMTSSPSSRHRRRRRNVRVDPSEYPTMIGRAEARQSIGVRPDAVRPSRYRLATVSWGPTDASPRR